MSLRHLAFFLIGSSSCVLGEVRTSASYKILAETLDGGGGFAASATYQNTDSLEPTVSDQSSSTTTTIRHGFIAGLTVETLSAYESWATSRGLVLGTNAGFLEDPNDDGTPNIQHFAFDTDPLGNGSTEGKQALSTLEVAGAHYLTFTIPVRVGATFSGFPLQSNEVDGITYEILANTDLGPTWPLPVVEVIPALDATLPTLTDWQYRTFRLASPVGTTSHQFIKAGVSTP